MGVGGEGVAGQAISVVSAGDIEAIEASEGVFAGAVRGVKRGEKDDECVPNRRV